MTKGGAGKAQSWHFRGTASEAMPRRRAWDTGEETQRQAAEGFEGSGFGHLRLLPVYLGPTPGHSDSGWEVA